MVQWLRFMLPIQEAVVRSPDGELLRSSIPHPAQCRQKKNEKGARKSRGHRDVWKCTRISIQSAKPRKLWAKQPSPSPISCEKEKGIKRETYRLKYSAHIINFKRRG